MGASHCGLVCVLRQPGASASQLTTRDCLCLGFKGILTNKRTCGGLFLFHFSVVDKLFFVYVLAKEINEDVLWTIEMRLGY